MTDLTHETYLHKTFSADQLTILEIALRHLVDEVIDHTPKKPNPRSGPWLGLTLERIQKTKERMNKPATILNSDDLWVLYCATGQLCHLAQDLDRGNSLYNFVSPELARLQGKLLQLRGFNNKAVLRLVAGEL
jgi:hypothetical protein